MKKIIAFFSLLLIAGIGLAQEKPVGPKPMPNFRLFTTDSVWFTNANLKKDKPVMIVYFMTDCGHCQQMVSELKPKLNELANVQIVMVTYSNNYDIRAIKAFKQQYGLTKYPNIIIGSDGYTDNVRGYYDVQTTPFIAVYDSHRKWVKYFDKTPKTEDVVAAAKKL